MRVFQRLHDKRKTKMFCFEYYAIHIYILLSVPYSTKTRKIQYKKSVVGIFDDHEMIRKKKEKLY